MNYTSFKHSLLKEGVVERTLAFGSVLEQMQECVLIDGEQTQFSSLKEAKQYLKTQQEINTLTEHVKKQTYEELSGSRIAHIIKEHHDFKPTQSLVESYLRLASTNAFSIDPVVHEIRSINKLDKLIEGKLHYVLEDESIVAISEKTQDILNNSLESNPEIVEHMRRSQENFFDVVATLIKE